MKGLKHPVEFLANSVLSRAILYIGCGPGGGHCGLAGPEGLLRAEAGLEGWRPARVIATPCDGRVAA